MTPGLLVQVLLRRFYVTLAGVLVTLATVHALNNTDPTFWGRITVVVLTPPNAGQNILTEHSPVAIASLAVMDVTHHAPALRAGSADVTLYGLGERRATWIRLRNTGNQWVPSAGLPYIDVDAVDTTADAVSRRLTAAVSDLRAAMVRRQDEMGVQLTSRTGLELLPAYPVVTLIPPSRMRAEVATGVVGFTLTVLAALGADKALSSRRRKRAVRAGPRTSVRSAPRSNQQI